MADMNAYLDEIIKTMNDGLLIVSPGGRINKVNPALERLTGYSEAELVGKPCTVLKCDACRLARSQGKGKWCQLFDTRRETRKRCGLVRKDGTYVPVIKNASLLTDGDRVLGSVETITDVSELDRREREIEQLSRLLHADEDFHGMLGRSPAMRRTFGIIEKAAQSEAPVLICGESGTGKELVARAIHELGPRRDGPYIQLNCAALSESLLESELFGHVKGAFTGAYRHREGRFEAAHGGDIFLDEIGDVPLPIQVKLLRILESKSFERVGDHQPMTTDVRFITATNRNLHRLVLDGRFREDFFFRINVIPIHLPALRDRREDIPLLVDHFVRALRERTGKPITSLSPEAMRLFMEYAWPGNVRELKSALEYAFVISESGAIHPEHLPSHLIQGVKAPMDLTPLAPASGSQPGPVAGHVTVIRPGDGAEREALLRALAESGGNKSHAARILGVNRITVLNRMRKYGIDLKKVLST